MPRRERSTEQSVARTSAIQVASCSRSCWRARSSRPAAGGVTALRARQRQRGAEAADTFERGDPVVLRKVYALSEEDAASRVNCAVRTEPSAAYWVAAKCASADVDTPAHSAHTLSDQCGQEGPGVVSAYWPHSAARCAGPGSRARGTTASARALNGRCFARAQLLYAPRRPMRS